MIAPNPPNRSVFCPLSVGFKSCHGEGAENPSNAFKMRS